MYVITKVLQNKLKTIANSLSWMQRECIDIYNDYWKTDASTLVPALATGTTPATVEYHLTKEEYINAITFCEEFDDFFTNEAVTQTDFRQTCIRVKYGSAADLGTPTSNAVEELGKRIYALCIAVLELYNDAKDATEIYFDNEISDIIAVIDTERIVYGSEMTKDDLSSMITLLQEFMDMIGNAAVTQGDYSAIIAKWERLSII